MVSELHNKVNMKAKLIFTDKLRILYALLETKLDPSQKMHISLLIDRVQNQMSNNENNSYLLQLTKRQFTRSQMQELFFKYCERAMDGKHKIAVVMWHRGKCIIGCGKLPFCTQSYAKVFVNIELKTPEEIINGMREVFEGVERQSNSVVTKIKIGMLTEYDDHDLEVNRRFETIRDEEIPGKLNALEALIPSLDEGIPFEELFRRYEKFVQYANIEGLYINLKIQEFLFENEEKLTRNKLIVQHS